MYFVCMIQIMYLGIGKIRRVAADGEVGVGAC